MRFNNKTILILGGNSDVGKSLARDFAILGSNLILTTRKEGQLHSLKSDLEIRYSIKCDIEFFDVIKFDTHKLFYQNLNTTPDIVITCIGYLDNQKISENDYDETLKSIQSNFSGLVSILNIMSNDFEERDSGFIVGLSSVAGDRGRGSNYIYGCSKSAFTAYLSGLRNRLANKHVYVLTIKPGFIRTKMTKHLSLPKLLSSTPEEVSRIIVKAIRKKRNIVYIKWFWKLVMLFINLIPESIFKRMNL